MNDGDDDGGGGDDDDGGDDVGDAGGDDGGGDDGMVMMLALVFVSSCHSAPQSNQRSQRIFFLILARTTHSPQRVRRVAGRHRNRAHIKQGLQATFLPLLPLILQLFLLLPRLLLH